jgi:hypothetical protein
LAAALVVGGLAAGCGGTKAHTQPAPAAKNNGAAFDKVDLCTIVAKSDFAAALGEDVAVDPPATGGVDQDDDTLKDCTLGGVSQKFYLFMTLQRSPAGGKVQYDYDRSVATSPKNAPGAGGEAAFAASDDTEAHVEVLDGQLVLRASFVYYYDGGTVTDANAIIKRLSALTAQISAKLD